MLIALAVCCAAPVGAAPAQSVRVVVAEENFRKDPVASTGNRLATLMRGAPMRVSTRQGRWLLGSVEGWIWNGSIESTNRDGFDFVVSKSGGENLRAEPDGEAERIAVLMRGMLLDSLETRGGWMRVGREAWVWAESTSPVGGADEAVAETAPAEVDTVAPGPVPLADRIVVGTAEAGLLLSPEGDTAAVLREGADLTVLTRRGGWTRIRMEGWVWEPSTIPADSAAGDALTLDVLKSNPTQYGGRHVEWTVQYVALQNAEAVRTDFYEGEPYFLARPPGESGGVLYVAVPPELLPTIQELAALQTVEIVARVRTGRSALMGVPILDLIALR